MLWPLIDALARYGGLLGMVLTLIWGILMVFYYREQFRRPRPREAAMSAAIPTVVGFVSLSLFIWSF